MRGDVFVIMGGSGCGKSTLLRHMIGLTTPAAGEILYDGENFFVRRTPKRNGDASRNLGITFQSGALCAAR